MTDKIPISIIMISLNEKANIEKCLKSLERFDEVWLVDSNSTDRTCEIAESMGAKVVYFDWNRKYLKKRQWAFENLPFAKMPFKPFIAFFFCYVWKAGFLDGSAGFDFAISRAVHFWQIQMKYRELVRACGPAKKIVPVLPFARITLPLLICAV